MIRTTILFKKIKCSNIHLKVSSVGMRVDEEKKHQATNFQEALHLICGSKHFPGFNQGLSISPVSMISRRCSLCFLAFLFCYSKLKP